MIFLRKILFPISILYWLITFLRNWCYDIGLFKSQSYQIPIIAVGNLSVGGTGKTPHIEYLIRLLSNYKIATLSRGYKRTSKGFVLADATTNAASHTAAAAAAAATTTTTTNTTNTATYYYYSYLLLLLLLMIIAIVITMLLLLLPPPPQPLLLLLL